MEREERGRTRKEKGRGRTRKEKRRGRWRKRRGDRKGVRSHQPPKGTAAAMVFWVYYQ